MEESEVSIERMNQHEIAQFRHKVSELYLAGYPTYLIAEQLLVDVKSVTRALSDAKTLWIETGKTDRTTDLAISLAKLDMVERYAWSCFHGSLDDKKTSIEEIEQAVTTMKDKKGKPLIDNSGAVVKKMLTTGITTKKTIEQQKGNPRWLVLIKDCIELRAKLKGLLKEQTTEKVVKATIDWDVMTGARPAIQDIAQEAIDRLKALPASDTSLDSIQDVIGVVVDS